MKVRALASISGPMGRKVAGDEFVVDAVLGDELIGRGLVDAVAADPATIEDTPAEKPKKSRAVAEE